MRSFKWKLSRIYMPWKDKSKYKSEEYREYIRNYQKDWHQKNRDKRLVTIYKRKEQLWEFYTQLKKTLACALCGENHPATLQFHHCDPQQKAFNLSAAVRQGYSIETIKKEIAKCTVLCANCHAKQHYEESKEKEKSFQDGLAAQFQQIEQLIIEDREDTQ